MPLFVLRLGSCILLFFMSNVSYSQVALTSAQDVAFVIHGGAGQFSNLGEETEKVYLGGIMSAAYAGYELYKEGQPAEAIVVSVIKELENEPNFNAGRGSVLTAEGKVEMDASIMRGKDLAAGSMAGITHIMFPIMGAEAVMNHSKHVLLSGEGTAEFAKEHELPLKPNSYFITEEKRQLHQKLKLKDEKGDNAYHTGIEDKFGTVGCVALDKDSNLAAGTSTGGTSMKRYGRIGDSPLIGAGTYADNKTCGISCTGHGEIFIRAAAAYQVHARMAFGVSNLQEAVKETLKELEGLEAHSGGLIALDGKANAIIGSNTSGMFSAFIMRDGSIAVYFYSPFEEAIYKGSLKG